MHLSLLYWPAVQAALQQVCTIYKTNYCSYRNNLKGYVIWEISLGVNNHLLQYVAMNFVRLSFLLPSLLAFSRLLYAVTGAPISHFPIEQRTGSSCLFGGRKIKNMPNMASGKFSYKSYLCSLKFSNYNKAYFNIYLARSL
jgi:hypothetical protein